MTQEMLDACLTVYDSVDAVIKVLLLPITGPMKKPRKRSRKMRKASPSTLIRTLIS